jgi:CheY-like chemotaxis protein
MTAVTTVQRMVLVVEDNSADAELVADAFEGSPAAPVLIVASSGRAALERLRDPGSSRPDLILLDLNLPGFSGLETLAAMKGDAGLRRIPVIVLTTSKSQKEIDHCYDLGAAAVLNKPLRLREHREMIAALERFWLGHVRLPEAL